MGWRRPLDTSASGAGQGGVQVGGVLHGVLGVEAENGAGKLAQKVDEVTQPTPATFRWDVGIRPPRTPQ